MLDANHRRSLSIAFPTTNITLTNIGIKSIIPIATFELVQYLLKLVTICIILLLLY